MSRKNEELDGVVAAGAELGRIVDGLKKKDGSSEMLVNDLERLLAAYKDKAFAALEAKRRK
jgi:hypothetical protein